MTNPDLKQQFLRMAHDVDAQMRDVKKLKAAKKHYDMESWKKVIERKFPDLVMPAEISMSVVCQLLIHDVRNPFALIVNGAPSSGKTITLNFFAGLEEIMYSSDNFTPASFVTNMAGRTKKQLEGIDLLPRIRFKTLIIREMATVLSDNEDELRKRLGLLTRVLDGEGLEVDSGVHGKRGYSGDYLFMMLGASVPFPLRVWKSMSEVGHRLFFYAMDDREIEEAEMLDVIRGEGYKMKETQCQIATHDFLKCIWAANPGGILWDKGRDDDDVLQILAKMAKFLAHFRGEIIVYANQRDEDDIRHTEKRIESPFRAQQCLYNLCRGHAVACGRNYVIEDDLDVALMVVMSSAPHPRPKLFRGLLRNGGKMNAKEVSDCLGASVNTAKKEMAKLIELGVCDGTVSKDDTDGLPDFGQSQKWVDIASNWGWWREERIVALLEKLNVID